MSLIECCLNFSIHQNSLRAEISTNILMWAVSKSWFCITACKTKLEVFVATWRQYFTFLYGVSTDISTCVKNTVMHFRFIKSYLSFHILLFFLQHAGRYFRYRCHICLTKNNGKTVKCAMKVTLHTFNLSFVLNKGVFSFCSRPLFLPFGLSTSRLMSSEQICREVKGQQTISAIGYYSSIIAHLI